MTSLKFVPKKIVLLFLGDVFIILGSYLLAVSLRFGHLSFRLTGHYSPEASLLLTFLFVFYMSELYDLDMGFFNARYIFRHLAGMAFGSMLMALLFFSLPATNSGRIVFATSSALIALGPSSGGSCLPGGWRATRYERNGF